MRDTKLFNLLKKEKERQKDELVLIPSENYVSREVLAALGSAATNKYAEGYPGKRYYEGTRYIDQVEELAKKRAKKVFRVGDGFDVNVQPYSGTPANMAVYLALLKFGDRVLGMDLKAGGHLTHGSPVSFSGIAYKFSHFGVNKKTEIIDYKEVEKIAKRTRPKLIIASTTAYPRIINFKIFKKIADRVGALLMADIAHIAGLVVGKVHPSPFPVCDVVTTTTQKTLRGPRGAMIFARKNLMPQINKAVFPGIQGGPHENNIAAIAVSLGEALRPDFKKYARQIVKNAKILADILKMYGFQLVSGGTDNHLILINLQGLKISGGEAAEKLSDAGIVVNKNTIPFDKRSPADPSGIRLGTPAITTRGLKEQDMKHIGLWFKEVLIDHRPPKEINKEIKSFLKNTPFTRSF